MNFRQLLLAVGIAFLLGAAGAGADDPPAKPNAPGEALPEGARARLGNSDLAVRVSASYALVPPDYNLVMLPDTPNKFRLFDLKAGRFSKEAGPIAPPSGAVFMSDDGSRMVFGSLSSINPRQTALVVRDAKTGESIRECPIPKDFYPTMETWPAIAFAGNGKVLALAGRVGEGKDAKAVVIVWDLEKEKEKDGPPAVVARVSPVRASMLQPHSTLPVLSADGKLLATRSPLLVANPKAGSPEDEGRRAVQVWDVGTGKELFKARVSGNATLTACEFSPDGSLLVTGCGDSTMDLWDVKAGKHKTTLLGRTEQGWRFAFSPDSKTLATAAADGCIERWATADGKPIDTTSAPEDLSRYGVTGMAVARDGRVVAWGVSGSTVLVWEAPSGKYLTPPHSHTWYIRGIAFSDDSKHVVTSGMDRKLLKWETATGKPLGAVPFKPSKQVSLSQPTLIVSQNGKRAVTVGQPTVVFDLTNGEELFTIPRGPGYFHSFLSADGARVIVVTVPFDMKKTPNGTVVVWDAATRKKIFETTVPFSNLGPPAAAISPSGDRLVLARYATGEVAKNEVLVVTGWDLKTGKKLGEIEDINARGYPSAMSVVSESTAVVATGSGRVRAFDYEFGRGGDVVAPETHIDPGPIVLSPDGKRYAYGVSTKDPTVFGVRIHAWPSGKELHTFTGHRNRVTALAFSPDGKTLASGSWDTTVVLWDLTKIAPPK